MIKNTQELSVTSMIQLSTKAEPINAAIGVFHGMAGMAAAMPGLINFPSAGKEIEANR